MKDEKFIHKVTAYLQRDLDIHKVTTKAGGRYIIDAGKLENAIDCATQFYTVQEFKKEFLASKVNRVFVYVWYKGRWVGSTAVKGSRGAVLFYYFSGGSALLSECIVKVYVPGPPK
jgi:hypothetical protein